MPTARSAATIVTSFHEMGRFVISNADGGPTWLPVKARLPPGSSALPGT